MARDRLAAIRAAQDPGYHSFPQQATSPPSRSDAPSPPPLGGYGGASSPTYGGSDFEYSEAWVAPQHGGRSRASFDDLGAPSSVPATRSNSAGSSSSAARRTHGSRPSQSQRHLAQAPPLPSVTQSDSADSRQSSIVGEAMSPDMAEPPRDFNPFYSSQYKPGPPAIARQQSVSSAGGGRLSEDRGRPTITETEPVAPTFKPDFNPYAPNAPPYDGPEEDDGEDDGEGEYDEKESSTDVKRHTLGLESAQDLPAKKEEHSTPVPEGNGKPKIKAGDVPYEGMNDFFEEISDLQQSVRQCGEEIIEIQSLHQRLLSLPSADDPQAIAATQRLASLSASTRSFFSAIRNRILELEQGNANLRALIPVGQSVCNLTFADVDVRQAQVNALKERFKIAIQTFAEVERDSRSKNRTRMERQVKTVNPTLSPAEVEDVVRKAEAGGGDALFSQAVLKSQMRSTAARGALREVESRAAALAQIEETLAELAQLFSDMAMMVEAQDVQVIQIEQRAVEVEKDMEKGVQYVELAVESARSARAYRWYFLWLFLIAFFVILFVAIFKFIVPAIQAKHATTAAAAPVTVKVTVPVPTGTVTTTVLQVSTLILSPVPNTALSARAIATALAVVM